MLLIGSISAINIQADKLVASKLFSLTDFGYYSLASTLAQIPVILTMPIVVAVFPRLASLGSNCTETQELFHRYSFVVTVFSSISAVVLILYTSDWILLWTHNEIVSTKIEVVTKLLLTGSFFLSIQFMPYYLALANGYTRSNIFLGIVSIVLTIPLLYFFINHYGMAGAGVPWVFVNLAAFFVLGYHILNRFLPGNYQKFVIQDVLVPLLVTVTVGIIFYYYMPVLQRYRTLLVILYSLVIAGLSLLLNLLLYNVMNRGREIPFRFWLVFKK
jgi:O-antigen/teichoic acid export membrane protein